MITMQTPYSEIQAAVAKAIAAGSTVQIEPQTIAALFEGTFVAVQKLHALNNEVLFLQAELARTTGKMQ